MTALLVKSTLAIVAALLLVTLTRRSRASLRHLILVALFAFLLLLPAVQWSAPALQIQVPETTLIRAMGSQPVVLNAEAPRTNVDGLIAPRSSVTNWLFLALRGYLAVATLLLVWLAIGVMRLRRMAASAEVWLEGTARMNEIANEANIRRSALVVLSRDVAVPMTFGFFRSIIVVPYAAREWSMDELTRALRHELEHVRREDWLLQLIARVACALYWPHPLIWPAWRRFCLEAERACDDAVIGSSEPTVYAGQLVSLARNVRRFSAVPALGMASRSKLAQRIDAILDPKQRRGPHGELSAAIVVVLLLALLVYVAPAKLTAAAREIAKSDAHELVLERPALGDVMVKLAERGDIHNLERLLDAGFDVDTVTHGDGTALIGAARAGQVETVEFLLDRKADPNVTCEGDGGPLIAAAEYGDPTVVNLLLDAGAKIDEIVPGDENALMGASARGHVDIVHLLITRGADVNARTYERGDLRTPLRLARRNAHEEVARILIAAGAKE
ncbi:MAG TPA: M56 family metallopeptidase [Thermoanaerobaculia bacterium]|jgi:beta-lactamase regulating signal transducer with metallopeptidase domain|nr:M56 family metallopeptidase [Thermoanaerobaculia bacterium]